VPDLVEELILLDLSDVEVGMYREAEASGDTLRVRQLCCHVQISNMDKVILGSEKLTLDEVRQRTIDHREKELARAKKGMS
jgi:hypothetical protein